MDLTPRRRNAISTVLALVLAIESVSAVAAAGATYRVADQAPGGAGAEAPVALPAPRDLVGVQALPSLSGGAPRRAAGVRFNTLAETAALSPGRPAEQTILSPAAAAAAQLPAPKAKSESKAESKAGAGGKASAKEYRGRNHVWIPALGINRSVRLFPCDRSRPPDNYVYRWGCAGSNNVYLMGHAHSVFKPLHDAYVSGRLRKGMKVWYANGNGKVRVYSVRWWKVTAPTTSASWAWASQRVPSMTLQTCVGKNSQYRLMVRLVETGS